MPDQRTASSNLTRGIDQTVKPDKPIPPKRNINDKGYKPNPPKPKYNSAYFC